MQIIQINQDQLSEYASLSIAFQVNEILSVSLLDSGLGGLTLSPQPVSPYRKDYDALGSPLEWPTAFDIRNWGIFLATDEQFNPIGGAAVAWNTDGVDMLEGRRDLAVLWDLRVSEQARRNGIGKALFWHAVSWSKALGCKTLKIETQNTNLPACRFYESQGCQLGDVRCFAYAEDARVADEVQLNWYLTL